MLSMGFLKTKCNPNDFPKVPLFMSFNVKIKWYIYWPSLHYGEHRQTIYLKFVFGNNNG